MSSSQLLLEMRMINTNRPLDLIRFWRNNGSLLLSAPYQRGDVWGNTRRQNLIRSVFLGIPIPSIVVNDRLTGGWEEGQWQYAVIDGKQRCTTVLMFFDEQLRIPGAWVGSEKDLVTFSEMPNRYQFRFKNHAIAFTEAAVSSLEEEMEVFELINFGGVRQGEKD